MEYRLITAVSGFPSLYDSTSLTYRDLNMRSDAWRRVAQMVGVPESECRRKWKMLRDQHRRERQREKDRRESGVGLLNYRPWRYSAILSFLNPFIDARAAGTNGWALDPPPSRLPGPDMMGCSTTTEARSEDDESYDVSVADATTTSLEFVERKRPSSAAGDAVRLKEAKTEATPEGAVTYDGPQTQPVQQVNVRDLFEAIAQSVTSLATSIVSSHSSPAVPQPDPQAPRGLPPSRSPSGPVRLKTEDQEAAGPALSDQTDEEEERRGVSSGPARVRRRSPERRLEEDLRRAETGGDRDADQRDDVTLFLLSLAPAMRRLPTEKQSWVRTRIQQLLHEAEFGPTNFQS